MTKAMALAALLLAPAAMLGQSNDKPGAWASQPARDESRPDTPLGLRSLNEKQVGESGFVNRRVVRVKLTHAAEEVCPVP
jgi:hypothetical protein